METIKEYKAIISIVIMGLLLLGLAYMGRDCPAPTEPVQPETLSQQHGIEDQVTLWIIMRHI